MSRITSCGIFQVQKRRLVRNEFGLREARLVIQEKSCYTTKTDPSSVVFFCSAESAEKKLESKSSPKCISKSVREKLSRFWYCPFQQRQQQTAFQFRDTLESELHPLSLSLSLSLLLQKIEIDLKKDRSRFTSSSSSRTNSERNLSCPALTCRRKTREGESNNARME